MRWSSRHQAGETITWNIDTLPASAGFRRGLYDSPDDGLEGRNGGTRMTLLEASARLAEGWHIERSPNGTYLLTLYGERKAFSVSLEGIMDKYRRLKDDRNAKV